MSASVNETGAGPAGSVAVREDTWGQEVVAQGDLTPAAAAASARARIEARVVIAMKSPRDEDLFAQQIQLLCKRPSFAATALYCRPVGRKKNAQGEWEEAYAVDWSIKAIQAFLRHYRHVDTRASIVYDDVTKTCLSVEVLDIQANVSHTREMMLEKTVERRQLKKGQRALRMRENTYGDTVYIVEATPEEFRSKLGAETSKLLRDNGKRLLPADILEEARATVDTVNDDQNARDPDAAKKKILKKFASVGVAADQLKAYLDRPIEALTVKDLAELGVLFNGLKEGDFSWADVMRMKTEPAEEPAATGAPAPEAEGKRAKLKDQISKAREAKTEPQVKE